MKKIFPRDERLESLKYKAGYYAFYTLVGLMWLIILITFTVAKENFHFLLFSCIGALIFSMTVYELAAREYLDYVQAMKMKYPELRRREKILQILRFFAGASFIFAWKYSEEKKFLPALLYAVIFTTLVSGSAWIAKDAAKIEYATEEQDGK